MQSEAWQSESSCMECRACRRPGYAKAPPNAHAALTCERVAHQAGLLCRAQRPHPVLPAIMSSFYL
jgi:hypothetical protein